MRIYTAEELGRCSDYEVQRVFDEIEYKLRVQRKKRNNNRDYQSELEIEACYVYRELQRRDERAKAHKNYIASLS